MSKESKTEKVSTELMVKASITKDKLYLRERVAHAEFEDGKEIEVAVGMNGYVLVQITYPEKPGVPRMPWRTYEINAEDLVRAVAKKEGIL